MKTALLLGGDSPEREVSLMSGEQVGAALRRLGADVLEFDPAQTPLAQLAEAGVARAFNILHGGAGENGEVQGALRMMKIPFTGSGVLASSLAMDKHRAKMIFRSRGIPTPDWYLAQSAADGDEALRRLGLPLFVKPESGGSSTHTGAVLDAKDLPAAIENALLEDGGALVERLITGGEYTASVLNGKALPLIKISAAGGGYYDYHAKYIAEDTRFDCPCGLAPEKEKEFADIAVRCFEALDCHFWGRVDLMMTEQGEPMVLEVNTVPGMTSHSLVPMAAKAAGVDFDELVRQILENAR